MGHPRRHAIVTTRIGLRHATQFLGLASMTAFATIAALPGTGAAAASASPRITAAATSGADIGSAIVITGSTSGALQTAASEYWYVVYPAAKGGVVKFNVKDTTPSNSSGCTSVSFAINDTYGNSLASGNLGAGVSQAESVSAPGSDRYYINVAPYDCSSTSAPMTYSIHVLAGGGGRAPHPAAGDTAGGGSIGSVGAPLLGGTVYAGNFTTSSDVAWYQLYKAPGGPASVRMEDTTDPGANCSSVTVNLDDGDGNNLDGNNVGDDSAVSYSVSQAGLYYVFVSPYDCSGTAGSSYSIEPSPGEAWTAGPTPPAKGTVVGSDSIGSVGTPLRGSTLYTGTLVSSSDVEWYQMYKSAGTAAGTIRFADTTAAGANCSSVTVDLNDQFGNNVDGANLGDNSAVNYSVTAPGLYYAEVSPYDCSGNAGATYSIEPTPTAEWGPGPVPPAVGTTTGGNAMNRSKTPLRGDTLYTGTLVTSSNVAWYRLYKGPLVGAATVRFEDTSPPGVNCGSITVDVDNTQGSALDGTNINANSAVDYSLSASALYYLEVSSYDCNGTAGATFSIEAMPPSQWAPIPTVVPVLSGTAKVGSTLTVTSGSWLPTASSYGYQWYVSGQKAVAATGPRFKLLAADRHEAVFAVVTAHTTGYGPGVSVTRKVTVR